MCGFVGILGPAIPERRALLQQMLDLIAHRGPDGEGIYEDGPIALGHRRLAIFDTSEQAAQPMIHPDGRQVLAFNGAIYNHPELRAQLHSDARSSGDTEVLLRLLEQQGKASLQQLNGIWAFAYWDPNNQRLWLSRDRLGVKPLYWRPWGAHLVFASEPRPLLLLDPHSPAINPRALSTFLVDRSIDHQTDTFFQGIYQLPPASLLSIHAAKPTQPEQAELFWQPGLNPPETRPLIELIDDAVQLRQRADVSSAYLLSGGLDSSSVLASAMAQTQGQSLHAYSLHLDGAGDETPQATQIADHLRQHNTQRGNRLKLHSVELPQQALSDQLDRLIDIQGEPFSDGSMLASYQLMQAVHQHGHKVIIGGLGGDEALAGYIDRYAPAHAIDLLTAFYPRRAQQALGSWKALAKALIHLPPAKQRSWLRKSTQKARLNNWLRPGFMQHVINRYPPEKPCGRFHSYLRCGIQQWALPGFTHYEDRNAMHFGLEARAPLLDYRIIDWGLAQAADQLIHHGAGKQPLRLAMRERLPQAILADKNKRGLASQAEQWLKQHPDWVQSCLNDPSLLDEHIDSQQIWRDYQRAQQQPGPLTTSLGRSRSDVLWRIVIASRWAQRIQHWHQPTQPSHG